MRLCSFGFLFQSNNSAEEICCSFICATKFYLQNIFSYNSSQLGYHLVLAVVFPLLFPKSFSTDHSLLISPHLCFDGILLSCLCGNLFTISKTAQSWRRHYLYHTNCRKAGNVSQNFVIKDYWL